MIAVFISTEAVARAQEAVSVFTVTQPQFRKVYQRNQSNYALVPISGNASSGPTTIQARAILMSGGNGRPTDWRTIASDVAAGAAYSGTLPVEAGGWYQVQVRTGDGSQINVDKVGVGEVFITAGQSNAGNYGESPVAALDDRISAWQGLDKVTLADLGWRHADDPQPIAAPLTGMRGSPWPAMADILAQRLDVPIGLISVARGGTTVLNWTDFVKDVPFYLIRNALHEVAPTGARAILWHQGEADTVSDTTADLYKSRLKTIIEESRRECGWTIPWVIARASYVPWSLLDTTQKALFLNDEALFNLQIESIANAQTEFIADPTIPEVYPGPTTNDITGSGWRWDQLHMTVPGLHEHGRRWAETLSGPDFTTYPTRSLTFTQPVNGAYLTTLNSVGGTTDSYFGTPETTASVLSTPIVTLTIQRLRDGKYWNSSTLTWGSSEIMVAYAGAGNWSVTSRLPAGANLAPGSYRLTAHAQQGDTSDVTDSEETSIVATVSGASVVITTPVNNSMHCIVTPAAGAAYSPLAAATGIAYDTTGRTGISRVALRLRRTLSDGSVTYWGGGNVWDSTYQATQHERLASGTTNWSLVLPTLADGFVAGNYNLRMTATTSGGYALTTESNFTIANVYTLQGRITEMNSTGNAIGLPNVTVRRTGIVPDGASASAITNTAGYYMFALVPSGVTYTLTPTLSGRTFAPSTVTVTVNGVNTTAPGVSTGYWVAGRITNGTTAVEGATVTRTGTANGSSASVLTDVNGNYKLVNVPPGTFTVVPRKSNHLFAPVSSSVTVGSANISALNFTATSGMALSGRVTNSRSVALSGVVLSRNGTAFPGLSLNVLTDSNGYYSFAYVPDGTYTITPSKTDCRFTPTSKNVTVSGAPISGQNFIGILGYNISGRVTDKNGTGVGNITLQRSTGVLGSTPVAVVTNSAGYYTFSEVSNGSYTVAPIVTSIAATPEVRATTINNADVANQNFVLAPGYRIIGRITTSSGVALAGVTVTRSGMGTPVLTNSAGYYILTNVPNGTFTITPGMTGKTFTPLSKTATVNNADVTGQNFIASG